MTDLPSFMASFGETLISNGYSVIPIFPGKKVPGRYTSGEWTLYADWSRHCERPTKSFEFDIWKRWPGCAIGLACGSVIGIDIDVLDAEVAIGLEKMAREKLGDTPAMRIGRAPKRALYYRAKEPFAGKKLHPIEVYGRGSQMVIYGIHPDTQQPYHWPDESLAEVDISRLPEITEAQAMEWLEEAYKRVPDALKPKTLSTLSSGDVSAWHGPSDPEGTYEAVKSALAYIPNDDVDGSSWIKMCHAIKAALGEEGRELWLEWSQSSGKSGASGKSDTAEKRWSTARPTKVGAGTIYYLAEQRGWVPESHLILNAHDAEFAEGMHPAAGLIAKMAQLSAQPIRPVAVSNELYEIGGVLGEMVRLSVETAISPQPFGSLGAALCAVGTVAGRKYRTKTNLRSNLYINFISDSGSGKDHPRNINKEVLYAAGLGDYLGGEEIASGSGLLSSLQRHPCRLFQIDEMGKFMHGVVGPKAASHKQEIWTNLTKLYTSAGGVYIGTEYADQRDRPRIDIQQPCCSVFGVTVPGAFWSALEGGAMTDGSMARFLIFLTDNDYPDRNKRPAPLVVPQSIIDALQAIAAGPQAHETGNLAMLSNSNPQPYTVPTTPAADVLLDRLMDDQTEWLRQTRGTPQTAVVARLWENVSKVSLIRAISDNPGDPVITDDIVTWATRLVDHTTKTLLREADRFIADNETQARHKRVLDIIRKAPALSKSELSRRTQFLEAKQRASIIAALQESGQIIVHKEKADGVGAPRESYTAITTAEPSRISIH